MPVIFLGYHMSWKPNKNQLSRPIYFLLAEKKKQDIASGLLAPGKKLSPQKELADFSDVNLTIITRAFHIQLIAIPGDTNEMIPLQPDNQCYLSGIDKIFLVPSCCNPVTVMTSYHRKKSCQGIGNESDGLFWGNGLSVVVS